MPRRLVSAGVRGKGPECQWRALAGARLRAVERPFGVALHAGRRSAALDRLSAPSLTVAHDLPRRDPSPRTQPAIQISSSGELRLELSEREVRAPRESEVLVAVEASPINPSDLGVLLGAVDPGTLRPDGTALVGRVSESSLPLYRDRFDTPLAVATRARAPSSRRARAQLG